LARLPDRAEALQSVMVLRGIRKTDLMEPFPKVKAYYERCRARPGWQRTLALCAERLGVSLDAIC
jgi:glutathione S-transferase